MQFDQIAAELRKRLPPLPSVAVIGSTSYWHPDSLFTCIEVGTQLARIPDLLLLTGGVTGIGEGVGRSFFNERTRSGWRPLVFHILPFGSGKWDYGETIHAGSDMAQRREVLARMSHLYLAIEGGPGTVHEAEVAAARGAYVIPVGRSGGHAAELYPRAARPPFAASNDWKILGESSSTPSFVAHAVAGIVRGWLERQGVPAVHPG